MCNCLINLTTNNTINDAWQSQHQLKFQLCVIIANLCFIHWRAIYLWCGRCYISVCMARPPLRPVAPSVRRRACGDSDFSAEERKCIPQLLQLFRSGALVTLLTQSASQNANTGTSPPSGASTGKATKPLRSSQINATLAHGQRSAPSSTDGGWKPMKSSTTQVPKRKDKLLGNG